VWGLKGEMAMARGGVVRMGRLNAGLTLSLRGGYIWGVKVLRKSMMPKVRNDEASDESSLA